MEEIHVERDPQTWSDLPIELVEHILSRLALADNIRSSCVCKAWHAAALSVRVVNRSPWLMYFPKPGSKAYEFYDPSRRKIFTFESAELCGCKVYHSKDSWLLLSKPRSESMFFFNPFSRETINLPSLAMSHGVAAFSCAPTSDACLVVTFKNIGRTVTSIRTCRPSSTEWTTNDYYMHFPPFCTFWDKLVFCNGLFYCLSLTGIFGVFDPSAFKFSLLALRPPKTQIHFSPNGSWRGKVLVEHKGDIFVIYTSTREYPSVHKFNWTSLVWEEVESLDGATFFVSVLSSHPATDLPGSIKRNSLYFDKVRFYGKQCVSYSLEKSRYYPSKLSYNNLEDQLPSETLWINPPENVEDFI